jgi:hypothetical protein
MSTSSKLSKMAANRLAVSATVTSSATVHGGEIASLLHPVLFPKGPAKPDLTAQLLDALGGVLDRAAAEVERADLAHASELLDDEAPRQRRDAAEAELTAALLQQRDTVSVLYGPATARAYGLVEPLPAQPAQLVVRAKSVVKQLRENPIRDKPLRRGLLLKATDLADELEEHAGRLAAALSDVQREAREAQATLEAKNQAAEQWQTVYQGVTSAFYGLYLLAGRRDLAERIEPTARRRAGLLDPAGPEAPPKPQDPKPQDPKPKDPETPQDPKKPA